MTNNYTPKMLETVRNFFTDDEWDVIEYALAEYQDHGDNEAELVSQIDDKIYRVFNTETNNVGEVK